LPDDENYIEKARKADERNNILRIANAVERIVDFLDSIPRDEGNRPNFIIRKRR